MIAAGVQLTEESPRRCRVLSDKVSAKKKKKMIHSRLKIAIINSLIIAVKRKISVALVRKTVICYYFCDK